MIAKEPATLAAAIVTSTFAPLPEAIAAIVFANIAFEPVVLPTR